MVHCDVVYLRADKVSRSRCVSCKFVVAIASSRGEEGGDGARPVCFSRPSAFVKPKREAKV